MLEFISKLAGDAPLLALVGALIVSLPKLLPLLSDRANERAVRLAKAKNSQKR